MENLWNILKAVLQGIVQGITEWLPVSSTGHMMILNNLLPMNVSEGFFDLFDVIVQLGSVLAVVILYFRDINPFAPSKTGDEKKDTWMMWFKIAVASIPSAAVGLVLDNFMDQLSLPTTIATALIVYGVLFIWMESRHREPKIHNENELTFRDAFCIGAFQMLALIPGTSRSGSTILGSSLLGASRSMAARFSFFMAIPVMIGASGLRLFKAYLDGSLFLLSGFEWLLIAIGFIVAFAVSIVVIRFFMAFIRKHDFKGFGFYRIAFGVLILILVACGVLQNVPNV